MYYSFYSNHHMLIIYFFCILHYFIYSSFFELSRFIFTCKKFSSSKFYFWILSLYKNRLTGQLCYPHVWSVLPSYICGTRGLQKFWFHFFFLGIFLVFSMINQTDKVQLIIVFPLIIDLSLLILKIRRIPKWHRKCNWRERSRSTPKTLTIKCSPNNNWTGIMYNKAMFKGWGGYQWNSKSMKTET